MEPDLHTIHVRAARLLQSLAACGKGSERYKQLLEPFCRKLLSGQLKPPISVDDLPLNLAYEADAGYQFPPGIARQYGDLAVAAIGGGRSKDPPEVHDGRTFAWFEADD